MSVVSVQNPPVYSAPKVEFDVALAHPASIATESDELFLTDELLQGTFNAESQHPATIPLTERVKDGYGELILRVREGASFRPVTKEEYAKAYVIFQKYAPRLEGVPKPLAKSRIAMMREELRAIDPNMVGTFIPRTLHDLIFIRKYIEEDIEKVAQDKDALLSWENNSWCHSVEISAPADVEENYLRLIDIGFRLNTAACEMLSRKEPIEPNLRFDQIESLADEQIQFLQKFYKDHPFQVGNYCVPSLSCSFLENEKILLLPRDSEEEPQALEPMAIDDVDEQIIQNAIWLECQESSIGKILAYRGGELETDNPIKTTPIEFPYCLSFGTGFFAGIVNDPGGCPFFYSRTRPETYVFVLDPARLSTDYFLTPAYTALESLLGAGETWHYRYKVSKEEFLPGPVYHGEKESSFPGCPEGVYAPGTGITDEIRKNHFAIFKSPLSRRQLLDKYAELRKSVVILNPVVDIP